MGHPAPPVEHGDSPAMEPVRLFLGGTRDSKNPLDGVELAALAPSTSVLRRSEHSVDCLP